MANPISAIAQRLGGIVGKVLGGINASGYVACFVRKHYRTHHLLDQFRISPLAFEHANPALIGAPWIPSGQMILLPGIGCLKGPYDKSKWRDFDLTLSPVGPTLFHDSIIKDELRDPLWMPAKPPFKQANRDALFGHFEYVDNPTTQEPDGIRITGGWESANITTVVIPQIELLKKGGKTQFNKKCVEQFKGLFAAWEKAGLMKKIISWDGAFNPRYMRNATHNRAHLSNHAWGTAFDINARWNKLGKTPAKLGKTGCVLELVEIAYEYGFFWGGYFGGTRSDGMHFEVAKIL